jgi:hypothetical protein
VATPRAALAQVVAPSFYSTQIHVQGEAAGTEFDDWTAAGVPVADMDPVDNPGGDPPFIDLANIQIANDADYLYIRAAMHSGHTSFQNLFLSFDTDQDLATGFNPFGISTIGSEFGYQADFAFPQATGVFNDSANVTVTGGLFGNGGALIYPFWTEAGAPQGTQMEWAVPRNIMLNGSPAFASDTFDLAVWADSGLGDISQRITYTFAEPPAGTPGDYNGDTKVDAADYTIWRDTLGSTADLRANGNDTGASAGVIDAADYDVWKTNFGTGGGSGGLAAAGVPEPASCVVVLCAIAALGLVRRREG